MVLIIANIHKLSRFGVILKLFNILKMQSLFIANSKILQTGSIMQGLSTPDALAILQTNLS